MAKPKPLSDRFSMPTSAPTPRNAREARENREYMEALRRFFFHGDRSGLEELGVFSKKEN